MGREAYLPGLPGRDLRPEIGGCYGWPVLLENDANLAAWGERWRGVAAGVDDLVVMVADERLGSGLFLAGRPAQRPCRRRRRAALLRADRADRRHLRHAYLVRTLGAEAVADLGEEEPAGGPGRLLWTLAGGTRPGSRRRPSWRPPGPGTRSPSGSSTAWPSGWRMLSPPWPGCSTPSWWSSPGPWPTTATCSWTGSGAVAARPHRHRPGWRCPPSATRPWSSAPSAWRSTTSRPAFWAAPAPPLARDPGPGRGPRPGLSRSARPPRGGDTA